MENKLKVPNYLNESLEKISDKILVPYEDLPKYDLFLSQVIDYLNDKFEGEKYTNNIVQNYIKSEVISKPEDGKKRGYTKLHLAQLVLLSYMRPILTTEEMKKVFSLAFNEINDNTDDIISWEMAYKIFSDIQKESLQDYLSRNPLNDDKLNCILKDLGLESKDEERITVFITVMNLICQASSIKRLVQQIITEFELNNGKV
jgi:hypothetical protein